jgi:hypothetical protein
VQAIRVVIGCVLLLASPASVAGQTRADAGFRPPPLLFERLFRDCTECRGRSGAVHMVIDSPRLTELWLTRHGSESNGGSFGDNVAVADFWYDSVHRRLFTRSIVLHEVEDPADLRLGRAPGLHPNHPDFRAALAPGTTVGHVGFVPWTHNGFGSYFAALQGAIRDGSTGYLDLSTATGEFGTTRTGSRYDPQDLIKHVRLHPSGQLEVGFETDPDARPDVSLLVRGNVAIEGSLLVDSDPVGEEDRRPAALACSVRRAGGGARAISVSCGPGERATGGGGLCGSGEMRGSRPLVEADAPTGWELSCAREGPHTAYVICCQQ